VCDGRTAAQQRDGESCEHGHSAQSTPKCSAPHLRHLDLVRRLADRLRNQGVNAVLGVHCTYSSFTSQCAQLATYLSAGGHELKHQALQIG
jgi:hypothetical protein